MDEEPIPIEIKYISLDPTSAERLKVGEIIKEQPGNWENTFAGLPANLQERIKTDPDYYPTDAVLDASLQNHGYGFPPEVKVRMYEDFVNFLERCGINPDDQDLPFPALAEQFLDSRIESPMVISPVEPEEPLPPPAEPEIDLYGETGEPAPQSPPGITEPQELQQVEVIEQPEPKLPFASVVEPAARADQARPAIEKLIVPSKPSREFALLPEVEIFTLADGRTIELRGKITHGGYSDVYIGRYPGEETDTVVLKIAKDKEGMSGVRERFGSDVPSVNTLHRMYGEEAQILGDLWECGYKFVPRIHYYHPGRRVNIYAGETDESIFFGDRPYIVMDLAKGFNIDRLLLFGEHIQYKQGEEVIGNGIEEGTALEIARQIAEAFDSTLQAGYINYDIKGVAENIYWDPQSKKITVTDWNEARYFRNIANNRWQRTEEQIYQEAKEVEKDYLWVTRRVLYYLLTGEELNTGLFGKRRTPIDKLERWNFFTTNGLISTGTQDLLQRAFDRTNTYPDLASLKADLERQMAVLGVPRPELAGAQTAVSLSPEQQEMIMACQERIRGLDEEIEHLTPENGFGGTITSSWEFRLTQFKRIRAALAQKPELISRVANISAQLAPLKEEENLLMGGLTPTTQSSILDKAFARFDEISALKRVLEEEVSGAERKIREADEEIEQAESVIPPPPDTNPIPITTDKATVDVFKLYHSLDGREISLGHGAINIVRPAMLRGGLDRLRGEAGNGRLALVAIKTAMRKEDALAEGELANHADTYEGMYEGNVKRTIEEAHRLEAIRHKQQELFPGSPNNVPDAILATLEGQAALVMELIPSDKKIYRHNLSPEQSRSALIQYFQLMETIHSLGFTVNDKKGGDFYFFPEEDRLVVTDWNVVGECEPQRVKSDLVNNLDYFVETASTPAIKDVLQKKLAELRSRPLQNTLTAKEMIEFAKSLPI